MQTYIALLRGINVSGQKLIKMADLKALLEKAGLEAVQTYVQSGNIVFSASKSTALALEKKIADTILDQYGYQVPVLIRTPDQWKAVRDGNPFFKAEPKEPEKCYVAFLSEVPEDKRLQKLSETDYSPEEWVQSGKEIYGYSANGFGRAKLSNNVLENKLKVVATTRNWKTVLALHDLAANS